MVLGLSEILFFFEFRSKFDSRKLSFCDGPFLVEQHSQSPTRPLTSVNPGSVLAVQTSLYPNMISLRASFDQYRFTRFSTKREKWVDAYCRNRCASSRRKILNKNNYVISEFFLTVIIIWYFAKGVLEVGKKYLKKIKIESLVIFLLYYYYYYSVIRDECASSRSYDLETVVQSRAYEVGKWCGQVRMKRENGAVRCVKSG